MVGADGAAAGVELFGVAELAGLELKGLEELPPSPFAPF